MAKAPCDGKDCCHDWKSAGTPEEKAAKTRKRINKERFVPAFKNHRLSGETAVLRSPRLETCRQVGRSIDTIPTGD
jgi:hypothetical protein